MDKLVIGFVVFEIAWLAGVYFSYQTLIKNRNRYVECILCCILVAVCGWVIGLPLVIWLSAAQAVLLAIRWKIYAHERTEK